MIAHFVFAFVPYAIMLGLVLAMAGPRDPVPRVIAAPFFIVVVLIAGFSPWLLLQALLTWTVGLVCLLLHVRLRTLVLASVAITAATFGFYVFANYATLQEFLALRVEYPVISLADRLAYESESHRRATPTAAPSNQAVESQLLTWEDRKISWRSYTLYQLHGQTYAGFVWTNGFGLGRMSLQRRMRRNVELPDAGPVSLPPVSYPLPELNVADQVPQAGDVLLKHRPPSNTALKATYTAGIEQFLDPERMGYATDRDHVVGFQTHGFRPGPELTSATSATSGWHVTRLELVSLLKHETPVAYVSEHLPRMDELRRAPTRPLDEFERLSLEKLWSQEDLVIDEQPHRIRMLGAVRAAKQCLTCHSVQRGQLLGAFSYELVPVRPLPAIQKPDEPRPRA